LKFSKDQAEVYSFGDKEIWATIVLYITHENGGHLFIDSDYGSWSKYWSHCGTNLKLFLIKIDTGYYLPHKLCSGKKEVNWNLTKEEILKEVNDFYNDSENKESSELEITEAKEIIENFFELENWQDRNCFWEVLYNNSDYEKLFRKVFGDDLDGIPFVEEYPSDLCQFIKKIWPSFINVLREEITKPEVKI